MDDDEIFVTPQMITAGREAFETIGEVETDQLVEIIYRAMAAKGPPSVIHAPEIAMEGKKWTAKIGDNPHDGVWGYGDSVAEAMADFDRLWVERIKVGSEPGRRFKWPFSGR